ncbi:MAG: helix-turn-helix transcriptional regulator [Spirochaetes bacterium]|nr:helix-turn-helix transcriptional regulator [Spirochaetota bacterium]
MDRIVPRIPHRLMDTPRARCRDERRQSLEYVAKAMALIGEGNRAVSRGTLARELGLHPDYLGKLFKACTGRNIREYMNRVRIARAVELILSGDGGDGEIMRIALDVGFASVRSFYRCFRRIMGLPPLEYRYTVRSRRVHENVAAGESDGVGCLEMAQMNENEEG